MSASTDSASDTPSTDGEVFTLHRYYLWANRMRAELDALIAKKGDFEDAQVEVLRLMSLWYALLYVVVEGWHSLGLADEKIDKLLESSCVDLLRRYRNGVFHFQPDYFDPRLTDFFGDPTTPAWVRSLNMEFGRFFLLWIKKTQAEE